MQIMVGFPETVLLEPTTNAGVFSHSRRLQRRPNTEWPR